MRNAWRFGRILWILLLTAIPVFSKSNLDHLATKCRSGDVRACRKITEIAEESKDSAVRREAIPYVIDRASLEKLANADPDPAVRQAAVQALARLHARGNSGPPPYDVLDRLTDQTSLVQVAITTKDYYVRAMAVEKLPDAVLDQIDPDKQESADFKAAISNKTVASLSRFIQQHPDGLRVERAFHAIWTMLMAEFPPETFYCSARTFRFLFYPDEGGVNLFAAIKEHRPFLVAFAPREVLVGHGFTVNWRELAGQPVTINAIQPNLTKPNGDFIYLQKNSLEINPVFIPPNGGGSYEWGLLLIPGKLNLTPLSFVTKGANLVTATTTTQVISGPPS